MNKEVDDILNSWGGVKKPSLTEIDRQKMVAFLPKNEISIVHWTVVAAASLLIVFNLWLFVSNGQQVSKSNTSYWSSHEF